MKEPNAYLQKRRIEQQTFLTVGMDTGFQKCWDLVQLALRDKTVMGKDTFGRVRMIRLYKALQKLEHDFGDAWCDTVDADYLQEKLDAELRQLYGKDAVSFAGRYPHIKKTDYSHGKKKWR